MENEEWYADLLTECSAVVTEYGFMSRWSRIEGYWNLGKAINERFSHFERAKIYGQSIVRKVSKDLGMSERTLHYAVKFYQKFPDLQKLPMGKNANWTMVVNNLLPEYHLPKETAKPKHECPFCHQTW